MSAATVYHHYETTTAAELPLGTAAMPELTPEQQQEWDEQWAPLLREAVGERADETAFGTTEDRLIGDFLVHKVGDRTGLITATRIYDARDDRWLPQSLRAMLPTADVHAAASPDRPGQPSYIGITTKHEKAPARRSHESLRLLATYVAGVIHF